MHMKAIELKSIEGLAGLSVVEVERPQPAPHEILIEVKAAGINFAELEMIQGMYPASKPLPYILGFEAAGVVVALGSEVKGLACGHRVAALVSSGGYAEYATADAKNAIPIPQGASFAQASSITIQGLTAYTMLKLAARLQPGESILIQAAAGGVGIFLVQLAKILGAGRVIALASSPAKLNLVKELGADVAVNYTAADWPDRVLEATDGKGADIILEAVSGEIGDKSFRLAAPFGRVVFFGAKNLHDTLSPEMLQQVIRKNQSVIGFNLPTLLPEQIAEHMPGLLRLIGEGQIRLIAEHAFALGEFRKAFEALSSRSTVGKVVLVPPSGVRSPR